MKRFPYANGMTSLAQHLRSNATPEENQLWYEYLRNYPVQFRRQKPMGRFVLDFYCSCAKLAIELDGAQHFSAEGLHYDENRTAYLNSLGIDVLRYTNREIHDSFSAVCAAIDAAVQARLCE